MKVFIKTILIFGCFNHGLILAQTWMCYDFMLTNVKTIPQYPMPGNNVKIAYTITSFSGSTNVNHQLTQVGNHFQIENCLMVGATATADMHQDTVDLGVLTEAIYTLTVKIRGDYMGPPYCDSYGDSVWVDTSFSVLSTNKISEEKDQLVISIFPNPTQEYLFIKASVQGPVEYCISDLSGKIISKNELEIGLKNQSQINVAHLPSGLYLIGVLINGKWAYSRFYKS